MAKGYTLDTRRCLYGEPRLSDAQVRCLRSLAAGPAAIEPDATARALIHTLGLIRVDSHDLASEFFGEMTERGRKVLAAIDAAAGAA